MPAPLTLSSKRSHLNRPRKLKILNKTRFTAGLDLVHYIVVLFTQKGRVDMSKLLAIIGVALFLFGILGVGLAAITNGADWYRRTQEASNGQSEAP